MIINTNVSAMNTHRQMGINQDQQQSAMEKLSSGLRINKAGDDAAGLAISEKMRGQINGLDQASRNAQDGISMIQTAEGALDESHSILQRMRELSVQSANDTNVDADREELQNEVNQLASELDRIAENTEFNTQKLLDGSMEGTFQIGANEGQNLDVNIDDMGAKALGVAGDGGIRGEETEAATGSNFAAELTDGTYQVEELDEPATVSNGSGTEVSDVESVLKNDNDEIVGVSTDGSNFQMVSDSGTVDSDITNVDLNNDALNVSFGGTVNEIEVNTDDNEFTADVKYGEDLGLQSGDYTVVSGGGRADTTHSKDVLVNDESNEIVAYGNADGDTWSDVDNNEMFTTTSGLNQGDTYSVSSAGGIDISSQEKADSAISSIDSAIESVSSQRSELGAVQNRLEHTISNLDNSSENLSAAESRIRDADMAAQMMEQTQASVKSQAAQSMLAQANQQPQSVLQLLG